MPATLGITAPPSSVVLLFFDSANGNVSVPGLRVPYLLGVNPIAATVHNLGASGSAQLVFTLPVDPTWKDRFLFFQGVAVMPGTPGPVVELTNVGDFRMR
jgi:hypothetical protein